MKNKSTFARFISALKRNLALIFFLYSGKEHLVISFVFYPDLRDGDELYLKKFCNLDIFDLFLEETGHWEDYGIIYRYSIDLDDDAEGAALLVSKVLDEVYDIPFDTYWEFNTIPGGENCIDL
jgi:hypothetical protein